MARLTRAVLSSFTAFCGHFGIALFAWQREAFSQATARRHGRFVHRLAGISTVRGDGKSYGGAATGVWHLMTMPGADIISAALDWDGTKVVLDHARRIVRSHPDLERSIEVRATGLHVPATGSRWTITSREHTASRGRHPTLVLYDEVGWAKDDELFASLLAGQASVEDPLMLVISTVGRPVRAALDREATGRRRRSSGLLVVAGEEQQPAGDGGVPRAPAPHPDAGAVCA